MLAQSLIITRIFNASLALSDASNIRSVVTNKPQDFIQGFALMNDLSHTASITRRHLLRGAAAIAAATVLPRSRNVVAAQEKPLRTIDVISHEPDLYCGWPTLTRQRNGRLLLVYSGGRESHVCPFGQVRLMQSDDDGNSWTWPRVVLDSAIDDRDAGVLETNRGTLLVTTFTSLAYEPILQRVAAQPKSERKGWSDQRLAQWQAVHGRLNADEQKQDLGTWMLRSIDGGRTWSTRYDCLVNSPHGPIQLADGRVLYAGKQLWRDNPRVGVAVSSDDGQHWEWLAEIPARPGDDPNNYHELHAVETADGRIVSQIRNHNPMNNRETLQSESADGGQTWSVPRAIGVWGLPSHLLRLSDDRLLMTYGHRRAPLGNLARVSSDHGRTWSEPITVSDDAISGDLGYPSTVELGDGSLLSVWYEKTKESPKAVLRQARWRI